MWRLYKTSMEKIRRQRILRDVKWINSWVVISSVFDFCLLSHAVLFLKGHRLNLESLGIVKRLRFFLLNIIQFVRNAAKQSNVFYGTNIIFHVKHTQITWGVMTKKYHHCIAEWFILSYTIFSSSDVWCQTFPLCSSTNFFSSFWPERELMHCKQNTTFTSLAASQRIGTAVELLAGMTSDRGKLWFSPAHRCHCRSWRNVRLYESVHQRPSVSPDIYRFGVCSWNE